MVKPWPFQWENDDKHMVFGLATCPRKLWKITIFSGRTNYSRPIRGLPRLPLLARIGHRKVSSTKGIQRAAALYFGYFTGYNLWNPEIAEVYTLREDHRKFKT